MMSLLSREWTSLLEWYRIGWDHRRLMRETADLVTAGLGLAGRSATTLEISYRDLFHDELRIDPHLASDDELRASLNDLHIDLTGLLRDDWLDLLITHRLQPRFPRDRMTVIYDYPASQCALAKVRAGEPPLAERFELYLGPHELANGYHELVDASEQRQRFEGDNRRRVARGQAEVDLDEKMLAALPAMPACAGVALGIERWLMCLAGTDDIRDVLAFGFADA